MKFYTEEKKEWVSISYKTERDRDVMTLFYSLQREMLNAFLGTDNTFT